MSEPFPALIAFIGLFAIGLGALRAAMLRSQGFVPRGPKQAARAAPASPATPTTVRARLPRSRFTVRSAPAAAQPGIAR